ncbi:isoleucine--tRNA ligase [Flavihumibacter sp. CACIAM 22H1]|uniref:isoleucine--tRNA ligase n=1 Tax=Flavihumibacter sp. CACIAM 22H1 TaxID=1812911 RepID=UPI0007A85892|nr:isoleucine--tRNA ligase [Flavihumibacter sp. CACIAM 22H1]KYP14324.1 MAG: isoleucine--tRNA ligase [Flavihumibacter sp. CACIAM 22H1]
MVAKYREFQQLNLPSIENTILEKWNRQQAFEKSIAVREGAPSFVFYEGPPSANGMPGIHHVISRTLKDLVCRYKTMQGYQVKRKGGWDTHGLPIELGVEKELGITKEDIGKTISIEEYNQKCREAVLRFKDKWDDLTNKMGYWVDLKDPYVTFKNEYIETLWWLLKRLHEKGLLYKSVSIQPYSPAAGTGLSSHELNQPGTYKDVKDTSAVAMFKAVEDEKTQFLFNAVKAAEKAAKHSTEIFFLAWTTTPWTLPSNLGLTVGPGITYVLVQTFNPYTHLPVNVVLAKSLLGKYFKPEGENGDFNSYTAETKLLPWKILAEFKGTAIEHARYEQLLPYEANSAANAGGDPFRVLCDTFVTTEDGTGIVHTAPAFGADDYKVGKKYGIGFLAMVDREGKFVEGLGEFSGRFVKNYKDDPNYIDVNVDISVKLKKENRAFKVEKYEHSYPHCWRTDKPVLYYPLDAWFIRTTAVKDRMVELNKTINWKPKATGEGRFGNWLENMVDWNLSRSRYWGTPLPIWRTADGKEEKCIGSIAELNAEIIKANEVLGGDINKHYLHDGILDLHKPYVDEVVLVSETGQPMHREPDLIDVWFDSGAMPYAQWGLDQEKLKAGAEQPFKTPFEQNYPADFIAEGVDQTRGWFYTLHALGVLLYDSVAYKTVVSNGLVLDKNGNKMSKRLGNVVDPFKTIESFGADATRWYLITNASPWDSLKFDLEGIREVQRKFFGTLYNTYQFFVLYANVDGFSFKEAAIPLEERPEIDRWILSSLNTLVKAVTAAFDEYEPTQAGRLIEDFVDEHLSNWYVRLCRRRFWKGDYSQDKIAAYQTLYECLETIARLMAPVSPFFADWLFGNLNEVTGRLEGESVHHLNYPVAAEAMIDQSLEERMQLAQDASSLVLGLRKKVNIKVRQPLQRVLIPVLNPVMKEQLVKVEDLILSEVNVKELQYLTDADGFIKKKIKPNFQALGKRVGAKMKAVSAAIQAFDQEAISKLEKEGVYSLEIDSEPLILQIHEVEISSEDIPGWLVSSKGALTVALDVTVTPALEQEGNARELVNRIQKIRKDNGYELTDRIAIKLADIGNLADAVKQFASYIKTEVLADELELVDQLNDATPVEVNEQEVKVWVNKVTRS